MIVTKNIATKIDQSDTHIFGQTLITSINLNYHLIESIKDNCKVIEINDFKTIIKELGCTKASFYREIEKDLSTFSSFLLNFQLNKELSDKLDTKALQNNPYINNILEVFIKKLFIFIFML